MSLKEKWKNAGVNIGHAFRDVGKAIGVTAKVAFTDESNDNGEGKKSKTGEAWTKVGHDFAEAGKSLGKAGAATLDSIDEEEKAKEKPSTDVKEENIIDAEFEEKKEEKNNDR